MSDELKVIDHGYGSVLITAEDWANIKDKITELQTLNDNLERQFAEDTARIKELETEKETLFEDWGNQVAGLDDKLAELETELASYIESDGNLREKVKELQD